MDDVITVSNEVESGDVKPSGDGGSGDAGGGAVDTGGGKVKAEIKEEFAETNANASEPEQVTPQTVTEETNVRSTRKKQLTNMAEDSDLTDGSGDENMSKPVARKRGRGGGARGGRSRGKANTDVPANQADPTRSPRIVLKNIASVSQDDLKSALPNDQVQVNMDSPKSKRGGRGRGGRTATPRSAPKRKSSKPVKRTQKRSSKNNHSEDDDEDEEDIFEDYIDNDEDEDFIPEKKRGRPARQAKGGRRKGKAGKVSVESDDDDEEDEDENDHEAAAEGAGVNNSVTYPEAVKTGQYLIEKADMRHRENYPIWRMEGPNMLRKFEMTVVDGKVRHKSLYAYSSWAQSMMDMYEKIEVTQISSKDGDTVVEVTEEYAPKPPELESLAGKFMNDELLPLYNVYVEAMFRQALDHNFLKHVKEDNVLFFIDSISRVDHCIREKIANIESLVSMKEDFKARVRNCPNMKSIRRHNWSQTDQATTNMATEKGVRSVLLFGYGYDPFTMEEDKSKGVEVAQEVVVGNTMDQYLASYHGLTHFKFTLLRRCQDKFKLLAGLEPGLQANALVLKCLEDRVWILQTYEDLKNLLANENLS